MQKSEAIHDAKRRVSTSGLEWLVIELTPEFYETVSSRWLEKHKDRENIVRARVIPQVNKNEIIPEVTWLTKKEI